MKTCKKCGNAKSEDEFYKLPSMADGYCSACKQCKQDYQHQRVLSGLTQEYDRQRANRPERIALRTRTTEEWRKRTPGAGAAHCKIWRAIKSGKLIKPTRCEKCERVTRVVAHHDSYTKPLEVKWLCYSCHKRLHASLPF